MIVALGKRALELDLATGRAISPILWDDAMELFQAPTGSPAELRGALVLLGLADASLRPAVLGAAPTLGYAAPQIADFLYAVLRNEGLPAREAPALVLRAIEAGRKPVEAPTSPPTASAPPDGPRGVRETMPGLTRHGEPFSAFVARRGHLDPEQMGPWTLARTAWDQGRIAEWLASEGNGLGFVYEAVTG